MSFATGRLRARARVKLWFRVLGRVMSRVRVGLGVRALVLLGEGGQTGTSTHTHMIHRFASQEGVTG